MIKKIKQPTPQIRLKWKGQAKERIVFTFVMSLLCRNYALVWSFLYTFLANKWYLISCWYLPSTYHREMFSDDGKYLLIKEKILHIGSEQDKIFKYLNERCSFLSLVNRLIFPPILCQFSVSSTNNWHKCYLENSFFAKWQYKQFILLFIKFWILWARIIVQCVGYLYCTWPTQV